MFFLCTVGFQIISKSHRFSQTHRRMGTCAQTWLLCNFYLRHLHWFLQWSLKIADVIVNYNTKYPKPLFTIPTTRSSVTFPARQQTAAPPKCPEGNPIQQLLDCQSWEIVDIKMAATLVIHDTLSEEKVGVGRGGITGLSTGVTSVPSQDSSRLRSPQFNMKATQLHLTNGPIQFLAKGGLASGRKS